MKIEDCGLTEISASEYHKYKVARVVTDGAGFDGKGYLVKQYKMPCAVVIPPSEYMRLKEIERKYKEGQKRGGGR